MAYHDLPEATAGIESIDQPLLLVDQAGVVRSLNRAASALIPSLARAESLFSVCLDPPECLSRYLLRCSDSGAPMCKTFTFEGNLALHCAGNQLARDGGPGTILLRLLPAADERLISIREPVLAPSAERRLDAVRAERDEALAEKARIHRQYLALAEALQTLEHHNLELRAVLGRVRAEERERIAHDIHDQAGHELSAALSEIKVLRDELPDEQRSRLDVIAGQLSEVGRRLHGAVLGGTPRIVEELGLVQAIRVTAAAYASDGGMSFSFVTSGELPATLSPRIASAFYRVAQEAMTNVLKHARTTGRLATRLDFAPGRVTLSVADDGIGFSPPADGEKDHGGVGLSGMRRRMAEIGGKLAIRSAPGHGTRVEATAPVSGSLVAKSAASAAQERDSGP